MIYTDSDFITIIQSDHESDEIINKIKDNISDKVNFTFSVNKLRTERKQTHHHLSRINKAVTTTKATFTSNQVPLYL